jgi:hypothetical protein
MPEAGKEAQTPTPSRHLPKGGAVAITDLPVDLLIASSAGAPDRPSTAGCPAVRPLSAPVASAPVHSDRDLTTPGCSVAMNPWARTPTWRRYA